MNTYYMMMANQQPGTAIATAEQLRKQQKDAFESLKAVAMARVLSRREPQNTTYFDMYA